MKRNTNNKRAAKALMILMGAAAVVTGSSHFSTAQMTESKSAPTTAPTKALGSASVSDSIVADGVDANGAVTVSVNKTAVITTKGMYKRVSVGSPDIADVNPIGPGNLLITAKKVGSTQIIVWDDNDKSQVIDVNVQNDLHALMDQLKSMFPESKIEVSELNGAIALRGHVPNLQTAEQATALASPYSAKVLNFLEISGGQQVMLQVRVAEVSRKAISNLGISNHWDDGKSSFSTVNGPNGNPVGGLAHGNSFTYDSGITAFGNYGIGNSVFEHFVSALKTNNLLRVLAEPTLVAISGQEASFLAGGEIPVPVPQSSNGGGTTITIEYKQFGVQLKFTPVVLGEGRIRLQVAPEVSELDYSNAVTVSGTQVPALTKRTISTTVEMNDSQTLSIAGLLNHRVAANSAATPVLGDLPVLGALFRSVRYEREETELVVLITPHLVSAMNAEQVPAVPGETWRHPSDAELYLNKDLGSELPTIKGATTLPTNPPARYHGTYGFVPATQPTASVEE